MIELNLAFIVQIINFCVLVVVLNIFLYKPVRKVLAGRRQEIESAQGKAESVEREVKDKMASYESRLRDAKAEASIRRSAALGQAQQEEALLLENARKAAGVSLASIRERIAKESGKASKQLKKQADALSDNICEKILGRSL